MHRLKVLILMTTAFGFVVGLKAAPQNQQPSLAEVAEKTRAQKKEPSKPVKVYTNEDLAQVKGDVSVVGNIAEESAAGAEAATKPEEAEKPAEGEKPTDAEKPVDAKKSDDNSAAGQNEAGKEQANSDNAVKDETYWRRKFGEARKALADDSKELDILQREFNLKQQQYYADPSAAMKEQYSRNDLNETQSQIDAKKAAVERDKQTVSDLQDELRKNDGDPAWAN